MKTFDEALATCMMTVRPADVAAAEKHIEQAHERYDSLARQADEHEQLTTCIGIFMREVYEEKMTPQSAFFTMFMLGLVTGIEMEKQEVAL